MKMSQLAIDPIKVEEGDWVENIPELEGVRLRTKGAGNKVWRRLSDQLIRSLPRAKKVDGISPEDQDRINALLLRDAALMDWEGIEAEDGKPLPYSKDKANELLTKPEFVKFRDGAMWAANVVAERRKEEVDADAGKS